MRFRKTIFVIAQITLLLCAQNAWCFESNSREKIGSIDRSVLLELIKLSRFNIRFHQEANRHPTWRTLTYAAGREAGTAVTFAGSIADLKQRVRGLDDPDRISIPALKRIVTTSLIGNAISGSASGLELAQNSWVMLRARKQGYSPDASAAFVKNIVQTTDALFDERDRLAKADVDERVRRAYQVEGVLMRRIRQQLLFEFRTWSAHSRGQAWRGNSFYAIDALQNFTRMSAAIIALKGFSQPDLGGAATISTLVANSLATINPLTCGLIGIAIRTYQSKKLAKEFPADRPVGDSEKLLAEHQLKDLPKDVAGEKETKLLADAMAMSDRSQRLDVVLDREGKDMDRYRRVAQQQTVAGTAIGLTSLPTAILATIAFYDYRYDRDTTNKLLFAGRIPAVAGQSYALFQTPYTIAAGMIKNRKLKKRGELPEQLLAQRLKNLDALEEQLKATF
jgi:hypothetical protein